MSTRYRIGVDGYTIWDGDRLVAVTTASGSLHDSAKIVRALNERDATEHIRELIDKSSLGDRAGIELTEGGPSELARLRAMRETLREILRKWSMMDTGMPDSNGVTIEMDLEELLK